MFSKTCENCSALMFRKKPSEAKRPNWRFCSQLCSVRFSNSARKKPPKSKICKNCLTLFSYKRDMMRPRQFCSRSCRTSWFNKINNPAHRVDVRKKMSESATKRGTEHLRASEVIEKRRHTIMGSNHWNWKGGITSTQIKIRNSFEMREWRKAVFERDDYTCQVCGIRGAYLHADHIKPFYLFPELRFELLNGRTLCAPCHRKTPTYGGRVKTIVGDKSLAL